MKKFYPHKIFKLGEMDKYFKIYKLPKLTQEEMDIVYNYIYIYLKHPDPNCLTGKFNPTLREKIIILQKNYRKFTSREYSSTHCMSLALS